MGVADPVSLRLLAREVAQLLGRAEPERLLTLRDAKTEAGERLVDILPALRDELASHRHAAGPAQPDALVFPTSSGSRRDKDNARERVIRPVVAAAEALLAARGQPPLPAGVTAHKLRVYAHAMRREEGAKERLKALVEGRDWAPLGTAGPSSAVSEPLPNHPENDESPATAGLSEDGRGGFRTCDLSRVKRGRLPSPMP